MRMTNRLKTPFEKTRDEFEQEFCGETVELLVMTFSDVYGAAVLDGAYRPSVHFVASVNVGTGEFSNQEGRLEWLVTEEDYQEKGYLYSFKPYQIHHIRCQKRPKKNLDADMAEVLNNCYHLLEYIDDQSTDARLETLIETYQKPVIIRDAIGEFTLNRAYSWFEGSINFRGAKICVMFDADKDDKLPPQSFIYLKQFIADFAAKDTEIRNYITKELWETAQDWIDSDENDVELTEEYFMNSLSLGELSINEEGELTLYYGDREDIFAGHAIEVVIDKEGEILRADLVG